MDSSSSPRPRVSIVIPVYGVAPYIAQCLQSVLGQTLALLEVIVVDDCSIDGSDAVVASISDHDDRVRLLRQPHNQGQGIARNRGIEAATGDYVFFLDGDDVLASTRSLERLVALADAENADMVRGRKLRAYDPIDLQARHPRDPAERHFGSRPRSGTVEELPEVWLSWHVWLFLYRRTFLQKTALAFTNPQWEERPFVVAALLRSRRVALSDVDAVIYRIRPESTARRVRTARDLELLVQNAEIVATELLAHPGPALQFARALTVRQYVGFLLNPGWQLFHDPAPNTRHMLERYVRALESLGVEPDGLRSEVGSSGPQSEQDGQCALLWHWLRSRSFDQAAQLLQDGGLPPGSIYPTLLEDGKDAKAINLWFRTRQWSRPAVAPDAPHQGATASLSEPRPPAPAKRLILHIGTSKTGSTYLQHLFDQNRVELLAQGIWFPACGYTRQERRPNKTAGHARFSDYARKDDPWLREQLLTDLAHLGDRVHTVLLSSEAFFLAGRPKELVEYFAGFDLEVIVYLRRQDEWVQSQYCEFVAGGAVGRTTKTIDEWLARPETRDCLDYHARLSGWAEAVGAERLRVRSYEACQFEGGDLVTDFATTTGLTGLTSLPPLPAEARNAEGATLLSLSVMRVMNGLPFPGSDAYLSFAKDALARLREESDGTQARVELLGARRRAALMDAAAQSNSQVAREFMGRSDGRLFSDETAGDALPADLDVSIPSSLVEDMIDLYRRAHAPRRPPKPSRPTVSKTNRNLRLVAGGVQLGDTVYPPELDSLCELRPRPFLRAIALLASLSPPPLQHIESLAVKLRERRITKRQAAATLLHSQPAAVWRTPLPLRDKLELSLRGRPPTKRS